MCNTTNKRLALSLFMVTALALAVATLALAVVAKPAFAADIAVNTTADEDNSDGDCSLREAIIAANTDAARNACAAGGSETDTVTVPAGTYVLTIAGANEDAALTGDLDLTDAEGLTISGAGARSTTVSADGLDRIFDVPGGAPAEISGLTIANGISDLGGGVRNNTGTLTLRQVVVTTNFSPSSFGGVFSLSGSLNLTDSTVSGNSALNGFGGVYQNGGTANITNSTISGNLAGSGINGGVQAFGGATVTIQSSTITANTSSNPGGGIHANGGATTVNVRNAVVSDNDDSNCATLNGGTITSQGNNVSSDDSCPFTQTTNQQNTDPLLGPLADNGGPTDTHALLTGSPAIDSGDNSACSTADQRGESRPTDGDGDGTSTCDVGAFEKAADNAPKITPLSPNPGSKTKDRTPRIKAKVTDDQTDLAKGDITLRLDGNNKGSFTYSASKDELSFRSKKLKEGRKHTVKVTATDGTRSSSKSWKFTVKEKKKKRR